MTDKAEPWVRIKLRCSCGGFLLMTVPKDWWQLADGFARLAKGWTESHARCLGPTAPAAEPDAESREGRER